MAAIAARRKGAGATRPNRVLLGVLGLVALLFVAHLVMPGLFGGGGSTPAAFTPPATPLHLTRRPAQAAASAGSVSHAVRTARDPFSAPPGY